MKSSQSDSQWNVAHCRRTGSDGCAAYVMLLERLDECLGELGEAAKEIQLSELALTNQDAALLESMGVEAP